MLSLCKSFCKLSKTATAEAADFYVTASLFDRRRPFLLYGISLQASISQFDADAVFSLKLRL